MADKSGQGEPRAEAEFATRIDPKKEALSKEQMEFVRQVEMAQRQKRAVNLRGRNALTGVAIGALVLGIYGYTFFSVSQEKIMDELDAEAKRLYPKSGAN